MRITITLLLLIGITSYNYAVPKPVTSTIKNVTVFLKGAQVTRKANANIPSGNSELVFKDLPASMNPKSLQFKSTGSFKVLSVEHKLNYFAEDIPESKVTSLREEVKKLRIQGRRQKALLDVYTKEQEMILANKSIGGQQNGVQLEQLKATANFYRERLTDLKMKAFDLGLKLEEIAAEIKKYDQEIRTLNTPERKSTSQIKVVISAKSATTGKFTISYWVANAGWTPSYDLRVNTIKKPLNIVYKANVFQNSGEDWKKVKLTLSSGNPVEGGTKPELSTWYLDVQSKNYTSSHGRVSGISTINDYEKDYNYTQNRTVSGQLLNDRGETLIGVTVTIKGTTLGTVTDINGKFSLKVPGNAVLVFRYIGYKTLETAISTHNYFTVNLAEDNTALEEVVVTGYNGAKKREKKKEVEEKPILAIKEIKQTNIEFKIDEIYTILSDGQKKVVEMSEHSLPAEYTYYCVPKLDLDAFLTAKVTGWEDHSLLNGEANLFFEGSYLGKTFLDLDNTEDTLSISLGRDKSIVVSREKLKDYGQKQLIGGTQKETRSWEISVRNTKKETISLVLIDQFPISTSKAIQVEQLDKSGGKVDKTTGKVTWNLNLKGSSNTKKQLKYTVKYAKKDVVILE